MAWVGDSPVYARLSSAALALGLSLGAGAPALAAQNEEPANGGDAASQEVRASAPQVLEEMVLPVAVLDRAAATVIVYRLGERYYIPFSQVTDLALPLAAQTSVQGIEEPVIDAMEVVSVEQDLLRVSVPLTYFKPQTFRYLHVNESADLEVLPAAWVNYDIFHQEAKGLRSLGGTFSFATSFNGYALKSLWALNRALEGSALVRGATTLETDFADHGWTFGDVGVGETLPLLANRQVLGLQVRSQRQRKTSANPLRFSGLLPSSGVLRVMANQQLLYQGSASAGTFEVQGLPSLPGETRYQVYFEDGSGVRLLDSFLASTPIALLGKGELQYSASLGAPRATKSLGSNEEYERDLLLEGNVAYGMHERHNLEASLFAYERESWVGATLRSEWAPALTSAASTYLVRGEDRQAALWQLGAQYATAQARVGFSAARYGDPRGTPVDGFLSESKLFAGWNGWNFHLLRGAFASTSGPQTYQTTGLSKSVSFGRTGINFSASQTMRGQLRDDPFFAVLFSWSLGQNTRLSATVAQGRSSLSGTYQQDQRWGANFEVAHAGGSGIANTYGGYYNSSVGTVFASGGSSGTAVGLSGGAAVFKTPRGWATNLTSRQAGDSLLVVDTGAPGAEITVESQRRYTSDSSAYVSMPFNSQAPQRVELNLESLRADLTAVDTQHLVQTRPNQALLLRYSTRSVGFPITLLLPSGEFVPEGSIVHLAEDTTLVSDEGGVWLDEPLAVLKVQTGPNEFCTVLEPRQEGVFTCDKNLQSSK